MLGEKFTGQGKVVLLAGEVKEVLKKLQPRLIQNKSFVIFWTAITAQPLNLIFFYLALKVIPVLQKLNLCVNG